jgi:hypothetical protein
MGGGCSGLWRWAVSRSIADQMDRAHKSCMWLGTSCSLAGAVFIMNHVAWRWIFAISGERILGSMLTKVSLLGPALLLIGLCLLQISKSASK